MNELRSRTNPNEQRPENEAEHLESGCEAHSRSELFWEIRGDFVPEAPPKHDQLHMPAVKLAITDDERSLSPNDDEPEAETEARDPEKEHHEPSITTPTTVPEVSATPDPRRTPTVCLHALRSVYGPTPPKTMKHSQKKHNRHTRDMFHVACVSLLRPSPLRLQQEVPFSSQEGRKVLKLKQASNAAESNQRGGLHTAHKPRRNFHTHESVGKMERYHGQLISIIDSSSSVVPVGMKVCKKKVHSSVIASSSSAVLQAWRDF